MSSALPDDVRTAPGAGRRERRKLARKWMSAVGSTTYIPLPVEELEHQLRQLVHRLHDAVTTEPFAPEQASVVGARLVDLHCTGPASLRTSLALLGTALLSSAELQRVEGLTKRVMAVLGAVASGYVDAAQLLVLRQQESVSQALLMATKAAQWNLRVSEALADEVFTSSASGIAVTDLEGRFVRVNSALEEIIGSTTAELAGRPVTEVVHEDDAEGLLTAFRDLLDGVHQRVPLRPRLVRKDGEVLGGTLAVALLRDADGEPGQFVAVVEDVSELTLLGTQLSHQALHDPLTGLPNRQFFSTRLETTLGRADPVAGVTLYHLDLDAFSVVTDGLGRRVGDQLLKVVADRLGAVFSAEKAMVARLDGAEFAVLVENGPSTPDVVTTIDRVNAELAEPVYLDGHGIAVSATIGVVDRPAPGTDPVELLRASHLTLRRAKRSGRRQWGLFDAGRDAVDRARFELAAVMPGAWESGEIDIVFQSEHRLADNEITGLTAQLRWNHPDQGTIDHDHCVELAESTGLMLPLGTWLLRGAAERLRWWQQTTNATTLPLSIALTTSQATDQDLVGNVLRVLSDTGLPASSLRLALPSALLVANHDDATDNLTVLADAGVRTAMDHFTGSVDEFARLEALPVHEVRIPRRHMCTDRTPITTRVLSDLVAAAHLAGATVVVNGVDTPELADWWRTTSANTATGLHFAPPKPLTDW
ncbi:putative bifunctional diguanylate cyclase/phosphodiesterase [Umezawaea tangerina]|uniref:PAS domain S-box-containing protein/diguanylate cyclase (GGDEF)-like protein n=1 Tax=Umezawaea tangerina TaxID=84725 RepID=A0A2T0TLJ4_9PSEU|nr:EAL domain-containing protein [Umezawaea tangerina]PRY46515.1 PAS domain S-box-containing protein/diguanylate cyclase (GGDEF)-like protein [Umezawaea tangerina]